MQIEVHYDEFRDEHIEELGPMSFFDGSATREWLARIDRGIILDAADNPDQYIGSYSGFILEPVPLTVLDPFEIPMPPDYSTPHADRQRDKRMQERYGSAGLAESLALYRDEFCRNGVPFTAVGRWDDGCDISGWCGFNKDEPNILVVLFC